MSVTSHVLFALISLILSQLVRAVVSRDHLHPVVFNVFPCSHFPIIPPSRRRNLKSLLKVHKIKTTVITYVKLRSSGSHALKNSNCVCIDGWPETETGCNRPTPALDSNLSQIWSKMAGITVRVPLHNASWTADQSLTRRPRRFRVKPSLTRDLIWTALVQHKLRLNQDRKLDRRWWNAA